MNELQKIVLDALRKQAFSVIILLGGLYSMFSIGNAQLIEVKEELRQTDAKLEDAYQEIRKCDTERAALATQVEWLLDRLGNRFPELKRRANGSQR